MSQEYGKRVWAGDPTTVAEARAKYEADPEGQLIPFAVALYSFRADKKFMNELLALRPVLLSRAKKLISCKVGSDTEYANMMDVLSTYLEWMSRQSEFSDTQRTELQYQALSICEKGSRYVLPRSSTRISHTWCLLILTTARLRLTNNSTEIALMHLYDVESFASKIEDANQRSRVYRKLGFLYRKSGRFARGLHWSIRACFVPGVPTAVRMKSLAALLGVDA